MVAPAMSSLEFDTGPKRVCAGLRSRRPGANHMGRSCDWPKTRRLHVLLLSVGVCILSGCTWMSYLGTDDRGREFGKTYFVGGAGPVGNVVGVHSVPKGLRRAGYRGAIEAFGWQSVVGGTLRDQMDRSRNEEQARRLARRIQAYLVNYPERRVNIIALSAGTGIATWALENLPEGVHAGTVVFLHSSLSRRYDLSHALRQIDGRLYSFHAPQDQVLRYGLPIAGSVDGETRAPTAAGLYGFAPPAKADDETRALYERRLQNRPCKRIYAKYGYEGGHTEGINERFIRHVIAPLLRQPLDPPAVEADADATIRSMDGDRP